MGLLSFKLQDQRGQAFAPRPPQLEAKLRLDFSLSLLFNAYYFYLFNYLAVLGLGCGMRDLVPGSGGSNPGPLFRELEVLAPGPRGSPEAGSLAVSAPGSRWPRSAPEPGFKAEGCDAGAVVGLRKPVANCA